MSDESPKPNAAQAWKPTHRHYKGGLYREIARQTGPGYPAGAVFMTRFDGFDDVSGSGNPVGATATDDIAPETEFVVYDNAEGRRFARPAGMFDGMVDLVDEDDSTRVSESVRRFGPVAEAGDAPQPGAEANSNDAPVNEMGEAEMRDRFRLAKFALAGAPPLPIVQLSVNMLIAGGGLQGRSLAAQINVVIGRFLAEAARKAQAKKIIMPSNAPGVPNGLGGKGHGH